MSSTICLCVICLVRGEVSSIPLIFGSLIHSPGHVHRLGKASHTVLLSSRWCSGTPGTGEDAFLLHTHVSFVYS